MSVNIDTAVFERVAAIMSHFSKSVSDVQRHIDAYLDGVKQEFGRQLKRITMLLKMAKNIEEKAKEAVEKAEKELQEAVQATEWAELEKNAALAAMLEAKSRKESAKAELDDSLPPDEFQEYLFAYYEEKDIYIEKLDILKATEGGLKAAKKRQKEAKKTCIEANEQLKKATKERKRRESNLKEAKEIHTAFERYYRDYYRNYFPGESMSCNTLLTMLRTNMKREFDENMKKIENATNAIFRCSMKENVTVDLRYIQLLPPWPKSKETRAQMKEQFHKTMKELNRDMQRPEDEHPDYLERCKYCHLPIFLCTGHPPKNSEKI